MAKVTETLQDGMVVVTEFDDVTTEVLQRTTITPGNILIEGGMTDPTIEIGNGITPPWAAIEDIADLKLSAVSRPYSDIYDVTGTMLPLADQADGIVVNERLDDNNEPIKLAIVYPDRVEYVQHFVDTNGFVVNTDGYLMTSRFTAFQNGRFKSELNGAVLFDLDINGLNTRMNAAESNAANLQTQINAVPKIAADKIATFSVAAGQTVDKVVTFPTGRFTQPPSITYSFAASDINPLYTTDSGVISSSKDGFTLRITNKGAALAYYIVNWNAIEVK